MILYKIFVNRLIIIHVKGLAFLNSLQYKVLFELMNI